MITKTWTVTGFPRGALADGFSAVTLLAGSDEDARSEVNDMLRKRSFTASSNLTAKAAINEV